MSESVGCHKSTNLFNLISIHQFIFQKRQQIALYNFPSLPPVATDTYWGTMASDDWGGQYRTETRAVSYSKALHSKSPVPDYMQVRYIKRSNPVKSARCCVMVWEITKHKSWLIGSRAPLAFQPAGTCCCIDSKWWGNTTIIPKLSMILN